MMWKAVTCPNCGAVNSVRANRVPQDCQVNCSTCQAPLGPWQEVPWCGGSEESETPAFQPPRKAG